MLRRDDVARLGLEFGTNLATPSAVFEGLACPRSLLDGRNILPSFVVAGPVATMQRIQHANACLSRSIQNLLHVRNTVVRLDDSLDATPELAALRNEVVVGIDHQECRDLLLVGESCFYHSLAPL